MKAGRNDLCPCGSGKKYKKCCMNKVVSIESVIGRELDYIQEELYYYAEQQFEKETFPVLDNYFTDINRDEIEAEILSVLIQHWVTFNDPTKEATILESFIQEKKKKPIHASVLQQLEKWVGTAPSFSVITEKYEDTWVEVENIYTDEKKRVKLDEEERSLEEGVLLCGYLLPYGSYYKYFSIFLDFPALEAAEAYSVLQAEFEQSEFTDADAFMKVTYPRFIHMIITGEGVPQTTDFVRSNPLYKKVADLYENCIKEWADYSEESAEIGAILWNLYCQKEYPAFRKPQVYAAALHYFVDVNIPLIRLTTQKELANIYGVSITALSKAYQNLEKGLEEEMDKIRKFLESDRKVAEPITTAQMELEKIMRDAMEAMQGEEFASIEEMNEFLNVFLNDPEDMDK